MSPVSKRRKKKARKPPRDKRQELIPIRVESLLNVEEINKTLRSILEGKHRP